MEVILGYKQLKWCLGVSIEYCTLYSRQQILNSISGGTYHFQSARYSCKWGGFLMSSPNSFHRSRYIHGCICSQILFCITRKCIPLPSKLTKHTHIYSVIYISTTKLRLSGSLALKLSFLIRRWHAEYFNPLYTSNQAIIRASVRSRFHLMRAGF